MRRCTNAVTVFVTLTVALTSPTYGSSFNLEFTRVDDGKSVNLVSGQHFIVRLPAQPGTGLGWTVIQSLPFLTLVRNEFVDGGVPGGVQEQRFEFRVDAAGDGSLLMRYGRPWENRGAPAETFSLRLSSIQPSSP
jgi:predicted secreted protein